MTILSGDEQRRMDSANDLHALAPSTDSIPVRLWNVVKDPSIATRFFLFLMAGASMTITDVYLFLWLQECGGTPSVMGAALFCTCVTEVVIFYHGAAIKRALTLDWCLILTPFCYFLRQFYYWLLPSLGNAWNSAARAISARYHLRALLVHGERFHSRHSADRSDRVNDRTF